MWRTIDMTWTESGQFATSYWGHGPDFDHYTASIFEPSEGLQDDQTLAINCFHPPTTSSAVNTEGGALEIDEDTGLLSFGSDSNPPVPGLGPAPTNSAPSFGCE